uniref:Uncharacterized protein n=1 Tax=Cacopsylla melanoneura TaxID=428564 RepID=A0A8D8ST50_9HEMI
MITTCWAISDTGRGPVLCERKMTNAVNRTCNQWIVILPFYLTHFFFRNNFDFIFNFIRGSILTKFPLSVTFWAVEWKQTSPLLHITYMVKFTRLLSGIIP